MFSYSNFNYFTICHNESKQNQVLSQMRLMLQSHRNQSIDLHFKYIDRFLCGCNVGLISLKWAKYKESWKY